MPTRLLLGFDDEVAIRVPLDCTLTTLPLPVEITEDPARSPVS